MNTLEHNDIILILLQHKDTKEFKPEYMYGYTSSREEVKGFYANAFPNYNVIHIARN